MKLLFADGGWGFDAGRADDRAGEEKSKRSLIALEAGAAAGLLAGAVGEAKLLNAPELEKEDLAWCEGGWADEAAGLGSKKDPPLRAPNADEDDVVGADGRLDDTGFRLANALFCGLCCAGAGAAPPKLRPLNASLRDCDAGGEPGGCCCCKPPKALC